MLDVKPPGTADTPRGGDAVPEAWRATETQQRRSTVLITSAARDVGLALAREYAADGAIVIACCQDIAKARALSRLAMDYPGLVRVIEADPADERSIGTVKHLLAGQPIDIFISNARVRGPRVQSAVRIDADGWMETLRVNALGPMLFAQALRNNLTISRQKKLIAIASAYGSTGTNWPADGIAGNRYAFRASQAALINGMRALSRDWAEDGVLVAILHPDWLRDGRCGAGPVPPTDPEDLARDLKFRIEELAPATSGTFRSYRGDLVEF